MMKKMVWTGIVMFCIGLSPAFGDELFDAEAARQHFNAGLNLYFKADYTNAISEFEEAARIDPENANAYYFIGYSYYKLKEMEKARELFDQAYQMNAEYSPVRKPPEDEEPQDGKQD